MLRTRQIVVGRKEGNQVFYSLRDPIVGKILDLMQQYFNSHASEIVKLFNEMAANRYSFPSQMREHDATYRSRHDPFFSVSESTVTRWIRHRGLPAQFVNGQHHLHRAEVLEWATANKVDFSLQLLDDLQASDESPPSLVRGPGRGWNPLQAAGHQQGTGAACPGPVLPLPEGVDRELIFRLFLVREAAATTAIGNGIALPHVRNPIVLNVDRPMVTLGFLERPIDFAAFDGQAGACLVLHDLPHDAEPFADPFAPLVRFAGCGFQQVVTRQAPREEILREARRIEAALAETDAAAGKAAR